MFLSSALRHICLDGEHSLFFVELVLLQYDLVQSRPSMVADAVSATRLTPEEDPYVD